MATTTVTLASGTANNSYFQFNKGSENGGYTYTSQNNGTMYIGQKETSGNHSGVNCGSFPLILYNLPNRTSIASIKSIGFSIYTTTSSEGYNNCYARIEYIGAGDAAYNDYPGLWRCGTSSQTIFLKEGSTQSITITDATTIANFTNLIRNATSGTKYFFRIVKESGMGAVLKSGVTLSVTYADGSTNVYSGGWKEATPYVWKTTRISSTYPAAAMTSNSSQSCVVSASSTYSSNFPAWKAFNKNIDNGSWASSDSATGPWLQIIFPKKLYNITVTIRNRGDRTDNKVNGPLTGTIYGSSDGGATWTAASVAYSRNGTTLELTTTHDLGNSTVACNGVRVGIATWNKNGGGYACIGHMEITGYDVPPGGGWAPATAYVYKSGTGWVVAT